MNIGVIGSGYVGLVTGACFSEFGLNVKSVDSDVEKINQLKQGLIPIFEPGLEELVARNTSVRRLSFTTDLDEVVRESLVIFIAVGTPQTTSGSADLSAVEAVSRSIGKNLNGYKVVVTKSTVPMGTGARIREWVACEAGGGSEFSVASNPEFLREGSAIEDFMRPNRVVIGAEDDRAIEILRDLYRPLYLIETPFVITSIISAEMIKYASNAFLATKISYINEMADLCELVGANVHDIARGMGFDNRIGKKFLHPGLGFGGSCFPKDTRAIVQEARELGLDLRIVRSAIEVNDARVERMFEKIRSALGTIRGKTIALLGLSFKPNTDDIRESPALRLAKMLMSEGAAIRGFDPVAMERAQTEICKIVKCTDEYHAAKGADAIVVATEWNQFRNLDLDRIKDHMNGEVFIDLRNVYRPEDMIPHGFRYISIGR